MHEGSCSERVNLNNFCCWQNHWIKQTNKQTNEQLRFERLWVQARHKLKELRGNIAKGPILLGNLSYWSGRVPPRWRSHLSTAAPPKLSTLSQQWLLVWGDFHGVGFCSLCFQEKHEVTFLHAGTHTPHFTKRKEKKRELCKLNHKTKGYF